MKMNILKRNRKINLILFITILFTILFSVFWVNSTKAKDFVELSDLSYSELKGYSFSELQSASYSDGSGVNDWQRCSKVWCIHSSNTLGGLCVPVMIIDINPDGNNPLGGTITTANGTIDLSENTKNPAMAYVAWYCTNKDPHSVKEANAIKVPASWVWLSGKGGYADYINTHSHGVTIPTTGKYQGGNYYPGGYVEEATQHAKAVKDGTATTTYQARIIVFKGGSTQSRIIAVGQEADSVPTVEIKKYITNVSMADGDGYSGTQRANYSKSKKQQNPVEIMANDTKITYTIEIKNPTENEITGTFNDIPDSYLTFENASQYGESANMVIPANGSIKFTLTYGLNTVVSDGVVIINKAEFTIDATGDKVEDADYALVGEIPEPEPEEEQTVNDPPTGDYQKYITKVKKPDGTVQWYSREDRSNTDKYLDPVEVEKGDIVTYEIKFENTSGEDLNYIEFTDTMDTGLKSSKGQSFTESMGEVAANDYETYSFDVEVTASNMTLQNLENKVDGFNGEWTETIRHKYWNSWPIYDSYGNIVGYGGEWDYWDEYIDREISFSGSNMNADYVRLADPEIAGMVWVEKSDPPDYTSVDGLKTSDESGKPNIPVKLYDETGSVVAQTTTDGSGEYTFGTVQKGKVRKDGLNGNFYYEQSGGFKSYIVEFEYDGIRYEDTIYSGTNRLGSDSSIIDSNYKVDSSAQELGRDNFNDKLETIAYNKAYAGTTGSESSITLSYLKNGHISEIQQTADTTIKARSFQLFHTTDGETEYLKYINLGLCERAIADLSLTKDVVQADVSVNGFSATYTYNQGATDAYKLATPYVLNIYEADYNFRTENYSDTSIINAKGGESNDLNIVLTFEITIKNESRYDLYAVVREIIDVSTDSLSIIEAVANDGTVLSYSKSSNYNSAGLYNYSGYEADFITGLNTVLAKDETTSITVKYSVDKDSSNGVVLGTKANVAEIGAFSIYFDASASTPAGTVDEDSNPGIVNTGEVDIDDDSLYEDNTYQTSITIQLRPDSPNPPNVPPIPTPGDDGSYDEARIIKGNVWEDINEIELSTGQRVGDGIRNAVENGAQNVIVLLLESVKDSNGKTRLIDTGVTTRTDSNGDYVLRDAERIYAGEHVVRFIYGSEGSELVSSNDGHTIRFSGQDYKSTNYTPVGGTTDETKTVEATAFAEANKNNQISTAKDSELRRLEVIDYSTTINYPLDVILKATSSSDLNTLAANTAMFADTQKFNTQIEYAGNSGIILSGNHEELSGLKLYKFIISDINFGLIERPITKLDLLDDIKEVVAVTSTGEELIHIYFDITYELTSSGKVERTIGVNTARSKGFENVQLLDKHATTKGFRYVNIDTEILQGMRVTVKYQLAISNVGEIDTSNQNLINMVKNYDVGNTARGIGDLILPMLNYNGGSSLPSDVLKDYSYENMTEAISDYNSSPSTSNKYVTIINGSANSTVSYDYGYFLGNTYYTGTYQSTTDKEVETRVDQIISYVDNDLVFKPEENLTDEGAKFLNYNAEEIADRGLLKSITSDMYLEEVVNVLLDHNGVSYITYADDDVNSSSETNRNLDAEPIKNNLAFNVEDAVVNENLYKFLTVVKNNVGGIVPYDNLYWIELEASRILASENDLDDVAIDNLSEIVKMTNTVGRKTYIEMIGTTTVSTGQIGNTPDVLPNPDSIVGRREIDTNYTETVTFSPPTGLSEKEQKTEKVTFIAKAIIGVMVAGLTVGGTIYLIKKKKFYT